MHFKMENREDGFKWDSTAKSEAQDKIFQISNTQIK